MKKLMIGLVAASATIFAFGDLPSGTSFEAYATGGKTIAQLTDYEDDGVGTSGNRYWVYEGDTTAAIGVITNDTPNAPSRPAQFSENPNLKYLDLTASDATNVLYRAIYDVSTNESSSVTSLGGESIGNGLYLDTLVKFTPGELTSLELGDGDKIAITYVEETDDEDGDGKVLSNIVVRAGYVNGSTIDPTNYIMDAIPGFSAADWHRLTVRAINVGHEKAPVGFVVYVDGVEVTYDLAQEPGDSAYLEALANNSIVDNYLYNDTKHALIPSAVSSEDVGFDELHAVGFKGNGCVDDISFTATPPTFIQEGTAVTIAWDANVASYTVVVGEDTLIDAEAVSGAGSTNLLLDTSVATITVTAEYATGYEAGTWTVTGAGAAISGSTFTVAPGAQLDIVSMFPQFEVNGVKYGSFQGALDAAVAASKTTDPWTSVTIKALADIDEGISFTDGDIVLDLNGRTLQGTVEEFTINNSGAILTIIDSASGGTVVAPSGDASRGALYMDDGATVINGGQFDGYVITQKMDEDYGADDLTLNGGVFFDNLYDPANVDSKFYLYDYLGTDVKATYNAGYFTVGSDTPEPPAPTVVQIPTAALNLVYTGNQQTGVAAGEGYTLSGTYAATDAGNYIATATLDQDCVWSDETTAPKEINWSIAAKTDAEVVVTLESEIAEYTAQLAFPAVTATIGGDDVTGTPDWNPATISEPSAAGVTNDYTVTFTVTGGNYAGSTGTATFKVYKAAQSGGWDPKPEDIDPSATAATKYPELAETELATANAQKLTAWAEENKVDFAAVKASADTYVDAYLLNCAPDEVGAAKADFKATITVNADGTVTVTAPGDYNVTPTIQGKASLSDSEWHAKTDGDQFFRAVLSL